MTEQRLVAPFPYFGGKRRAVDAVVAAIGDVANYVEPFCGSAAILLGSPTRKVETINDADGFVANFWRAIAADHEAVARHIQWPVIEADIEARHAWLVARSERLRWALEDPDYYDAKIAGWWAWGACCWIGSGWCSGKGPHRHDGAHFGSGAAAHGVHKKIPHVGDAGRGVNRQMPHVGNTGQSPVDTWIAALADRLRRVRVACGDWRRVLTPTVTTRHGVTGVFLDPPYGEGSMEYAAGGNLTGSVATDVWTWATGHGDDRSLRIVVAAYEDGRPVPDGWTARQWTARKGYGSAANAAREVLYCSPHCEGP